MEIKLEVGNAMEISAAFARAPAIVMQELQRSMNAVTDEVWNKTEGNTPKRTSHLAQNWISDVHTVDDMVIGRISNIVSYAIPVELGVKAHQRSYKDVSYTHPGFPGRMMAHKGLDESRAGIEEEFASCLQRIQARIAGLDGGAGSPA